MKRSLHFLKTERMQVVLILLSILISAFLTVRLVVIPQRATAREIRDNRDQLEHSRFANLSLTNMQIIANHELTNIRELSNQWARIEERIATFPMHSVIQSSDVNRIDYKVQLYEIRQRLAAKSEELKIGLLPVELGLDESVASGDAIRVRMMQLRAVEKLADLTLDRQIQRLVEIYPMDPLPHHDKSGAKIMEEYPVRVECDVDFEHLYTFFQSVFEENQVFVFRNVRVESGPTFDAKLRVKAILSALLFE